MEPKVRGIVAYITLLGWIVAVVMNNPKDEYASFHIRQMLGLVISLIALSFVGMVFTVIPFIGWVMLFPTSLLSLVVLVFWVMGFVSALQGEQKPVPFMGEYFQQWFKAL